MPVHDTGRRRAIPPSAAAGSRTARGATRGILFQWQDALAASFLAHVVDDHVPTGFVHGVGRHAGHEEDVHDPLLERVHVVGDRAGVHHGRGRGSGGGSGGGGDNGSGEDIDLTETVPITPVEFEVPFLPDDVVNDDGTITEGLPEEAAERYAEEQNLLLLGHRIGMQVVTALGQLPQRSLAPFHLTNGGITAMYRTNGLSWAFDSSSCLVSTDALYWGLVGGSVNGPRWTPVAPGVTALPTPPAVVNNGAQNPVNSVPLTGTLDVTDQAAVDAILASLPDDDAETFEEELTPTDISPPYTKISRVSLFCRAVCDVICVPNGVNRDLGSGEMIIKLVLEARQTSELIIRPEFDSDDGRVIAETFSGGFNLGGNLS